MVEGTANVYAYLKQTYPNYKIINNASISYLNTLEEQCRRIIFLCVEGEIPQYATQNIGTMRFFTNPTKNLNLTGSPLKDDCDVDIIDMSETIRFNTPSPWHEQEESYKGVDLSKSRHILSDLELQRIGAPSNASLWILCDAKDSAKTLLLTLTFSETQNCRGTVVFRGMQSGKEIDVQLLVKSHLRKIKCCSKINTTIDSFFSINYGMTLKLTTTSTSICPNINDFRNSEATLFQTINVGDCDSASYDFWRQVLILACLKDNIVQYKGDEICGLELEYNHGISFELDVLQKDVIATLTDLSSFDNIEITEDSPEITAVIQRTKRKNTMDVTDKLWEILKCCASYKDLKAAFHIVFQCAAKCNIVNPPTNNNRLAEIIREVADRRLAIPCLTGTEPLELLLEIGLEKITKDYEYIFTESKICGKNDLAINKSKDSPASVIAGEGDTQRNVRKSLHNALQNVGNAQQRMTLLHTNQLANKHVDLVGFQNSKFDRQEVEYKLSRLAQIHLTLEHLLQIQLILNLENVHNEICQRLLSRPTQSFDKIKKTITDQIEIPIVIDSVITKLENEPTARRIVMKSHNKFKEVQTTYYYNIENILPPQCLSTNELDEPERESVYHVWEYSKFCVNRDS